MLTFGSEVKKFGDALVHMCRSAGPESTAVDQEPAAGAGTTDTPYYADASSPNDSESRDTERPPANGPESECEPGDLKNVMSDRFLGDAIAAATDSIHAANAAAGKMKVPRLTSRQILVLGMILAEPDEAYAFRLAQRSALPPETVRSILKSLTKKGLLLEDKELRESPAGGAQKLARISDSEAALTALHAEKVRRQRVSDVIDQLVPRVDGQLTR